MLRRRPNLAYPKEDNDNNAALIFVIISCIVALAVGGGIAVWWWTRREEKSAAATSPPNPNSYDYTNAPAPVQQVTSPPPEQKPEFPNFNPNHDHSTPCKEGKVGKGCEQANDKPIKPFLPNLCGKNGKGCANPHPGPDPGPGPGPGPADNTDNAANSNEYPEFVRKLNELRANHGAPAVQWDPKLAKYAQDWSNKCCPGELNHSGGPYGENLAYGYWKSPQESAAQSLMMWYNERESIPANTDPEKYYDHAGHFTALVWKNTRKVGLGVFKRQDGRMIVTASFDPPGNYAGQYGSNVRL